MLHRLLVLGLLVTIVTAEREQEGSTFSPDPSNRIIGGLPVEDGMAPYAVYLKLYDENDVLVRTCSGTIINTTIILTSAKCIYGSAWVEVFAGSVDRTSYTQMVRGVGVCHAEYGKNSVERDIGLVRMQKALILGPTVQIATLPKKSKVGKDKQSGKKITLYGWGYPLIDATEDSTILNRANMTVIKYDDCKKLMMTVHYLLATTSFCAETMGDALGFCEHDLGGPVMFFDAAEKDPKYRTYLVGISSDHFDCHSFYPNVFTSIFPFLEWLHIQTGRKVI